MGGQHSHLLQAGRGPAASWCGSKGGFDLRFMRRTPDLGSSPPRMRKSTCFLTPQGNCTHKKIFFKSHVMCRAGTFLRRNDCHVPEGERLKAFIYACCSTELPTAPALSSTAKRWATTLKSLAKYLGHAALSLSPATQIQPGSAESTTSFTWTSAGMDHNTFQ